MTIDEVIKEFTDWAKDKRNEQNFWLAQRNESDETSPLSYADCDSFARDAETSAEHYEQLAEWLTELKDTRIENKVLQAGYDSLIKENGELLSKVSGGDVLRICQLEEQLKEAKRLLKLAVEDIHDVLSSQIKITNYTLCEKCKHYLNCNCKDKCIARYNLKQWRFADEALKLIGDE